MHYSYGILELRRGSQPSPLVGPGKPKLPLGVRGKAGGCARVTAGPKRPHLRVCPGPNFPLQGRQGSRGCIPGSPGESGLAPCPWDSPGKNTGVGCHFLLQCMKVKRESEVAQLCPTLSDPMDRSLPVPPSMGFSRQEYWSGVPLLSLLKAPR